MTNDLFLDDFRHRQWWMMPTGPRGASVLKMCVYVCLWWMNEWSSGRRLKQLKRIGFFSLSVCPSIRPVSYWLKELRVMGITQCEGYPSVAWVIPLNIMGIIQCQWYPSVSWVIPLSVMGILLGVCVMGIIQCNGYPLECVQVRSSNQYPIG